jgi:hypothetical protein
MNQSLYPDLQVPAAALTATGLCRWLVTIQKPDGSFTVGQPSGNYVNAEAGLVGLACMAAPPSTAHIAATEIKSLADILAEQLFHVLIPFPYPQIRANVGVYNHALLTDPQGNVAALEIMGTELDSQATMTRLTVRLATL